VRLFVAFEIPFEIRAQITSLINELRPVVPGAKWVRPENLHLTLKFIGETETGAVEAIRGVLARVHMQAPLELQFKGLGFFPTETKPRVLWMGVEGPPGLSQLAGEIETALETLGFPSEQRAFTPHLTLARLEGKRLPDRARSAIEKNRSREFGTVCAAQFHLIESKLKSAGAEYTTVQTFSFATEC